MDDNHRITKIHTSAAFIGIILIILVMTNPSPVNSLEYNRADLISGPYIDAVVYRVIANQDQRVLALQAGEIEMDNSFFDPVHLSTLEANPDISIHRGIRNGYGHLLSIVQNIH